MTRAVLIVAALLALGGCAATGIPHPTPEPAAWTPTGAHPGRGSVALTLMLLTTWRATPILGEHAATWLRDRRRRPRRIETYE